MAFYMTGVKIFRFPAAEPVTVFKVALSPQWFGSA